MIYIYLNRLISKKDFYKDFQRDNILIRLYKKIKQIIKL